MSIGRTMVPVLLLLLLHESLADEVFLLESFCVNISSHNLNISVGNAEILENTTSQDVSCRKNGFSCSFQCTPSNGTWYSEAHDCPNVFEVTFSHAYKYSMNDSTVCFLYTCQDSSIRPLMEHLNNEDLGKKELMQIFGLRDSCSDVFDTNSDVKKLFIKAEKLLIHMIMNTSHMTAKDSESHHLTDLYLNVIKLNDSSLNTEGTDHFIQTKLMPEDNSRVPEVWMPVNGMQSVPPETRTIGLVSYMQQNHFQLAEENITSMVIRIELLGNHHLQNLVPPIKMIFRNMSTNIDNDSHLLCHYFDESDDTWKQDGCKTDIEKNTVECSCNHTTPFAVLMTREPLSEVHWKILSYISYIGCGLSAFFTALSIVMYAFSRNNKMDYSISIHVSLSGALFVLNTAFLLTEWGATSDLDWVCEFIAALMHYSLLCCFTWMGIEALHLYLLLIKVFNTYYKHYLLKLSLAGWGIPAVIVVTTLGMRNFKQFYGKMEMEMYDTGSINNICWITDNTFFYSVNLLYFTLIFVLNSGILMVVATNICKMKQVLNNNSKFKAMTDGKTWGSSERFGASCRSGLTLLGLTCLMGTTWGLAFLGSGYVNYPILYLFCILNSLQGFFIFLWICLSVKRQRNRQQEEKWTSSPVRTSATKSD